MIRHTIKGALMAGVLVSTRRPFSSMEINDQVNGVNGIVTDDVAGSGDQLHEGKVTHVAGISGAPVERNFSTAYAN